MKERHPMQNDNTQQPVAIVTGASSGIGLGITQALLERGWRVVATSRAISKSKDLKTSPDLVLVDGEVEKKETSVKVVEAALKHFGRIDLLVNNAGIFIPKAFTDYTEEDYNLVMNTNVASFFYMTQQVIPQMKKQNSGHVVNISAVLADQPSGAVHALLAVLSKSPMPAVSKALALEYAANNIRFNTVSPGNINTPMHANDDHAALAKFHPLGRMGEISDIVDAVLYLQNATFVTGENIRVDGGVHAVDNNSTVAKPGFALARTRPGAPKGADALGSLWCAKPANRHACHGRGDLRDQITLQNHKSSVERP
jgi:NAD(P)-dependent dehydrogenase (short-subunit alcohol dehydrogenase family)